MSQPARPLGVFDSGLGGLTVVRALLDLLPEQPLVYFGDTGRFPYGPKPAEAVRAHAVEITELLLRHDVQMVVVACNSASAVALDDLRTRTAAANVPVVGVIEPGVRAAMRVTRTGHIGVIGTVGTIRSGAYQRVASTLAGDDVELTCAACPGFVEFVESGDVDSEQVHILAERLLAPVLAAKVDALVLGCTHYPLLARTISDVMGPDVVLVSSAEETAFEVRTTLCGQSVGRADDASAPGISAASRRFITSGDVVTFRTLGARFLGPEVDAVEAWTW
jgi:glutamate racemase